MTAFRQCSKSACGQRGVATLTYVYAEQTAVLGPLATCAEPHSYDLCEQHAGRLTAPRGWDTVRLGTQEDFPPDDLVALADAVREHKAAGTTESLRNSRAGPVAGASRRGHLRVVRDR